MRFVLPEHGRLEMSWTLGRARQDKRIAYQLALRPLGTEGSTQTTWISPTDVPDRHVFEAVLCNDYTIALESGLRTPNDEGILYAPIREPKRITIVGGETMRVDL